LDPTQQEHTIALPYGATTMTVAYEKTFNNQTVWVAPGGVRQPTKITVKSNRAKEKDLVYTITPVVSTQNPAVLDSIMVDGVLVTDFDKNRFSYIQNRSTRKTPQVITKPANGVIVNSTCDTKSWKATVSKDGYTNTYIVYFHYTNDTIPNGEFTQWTETAYSETDKPTSWSTPGDIWDEYAGSVYVGHEIANVNNNEVRLSTTLWAALAGPVPAIMNLGSLSGSLAPAGGSRINPSGFIAFRNTPDTAIIRYKYTKEAGNGALFRFKFFDTDVKSHDIDLRQSSKTNDYVTKHVALHTDQLDMMGMDIIVDATGNYPDANSGAELNVDYIHFVYNSTLKGINVGKKAATKCANDTCTHIVDTDLLPQLQFIGEVSDQAQKIVWKEEIKLGYSVRTATITNLAEDGTSSQYTLELKRLLNSDLKLRGILVDNDSLLNFNSNTLNYTIHVPSNRKSLLDIQLLPMLSIMYRVMPT
jgi:hypothetical protein